MADLVKILAGDFVVCDERWGYSIHEAVKVSDKCFWYCPDWGRGKKGDPRRRDNSNVVFAGPKTIVEKLVERLVSSQALQNDEKNKAYERRTKRDAELLARANAEKDQVPMTAT